MATRINTVDSHGKWAVVTESTGTSAEYCITCYENKADAIRRMNDEADAGNSAEVMLTSKAVRQYPDAYIC